MAALLAAAILAASAELRTGAPPRIVFHPGPRTTASPAIIAMRLHPEAFAPKPALETALERR